MHRVIYSIVLGCFVFFDVLISADQTDTGSLVSCLTDLYVTLPWSSVELSDDSTRWWTAADDDGGPGWKAVNE